LKGEKTMLEKINAAPNVATIENGRTKDSEQANSLPSSDNTTTGKAPQGWIESFLLHGRENAIPAKELCELTGLINTRSLRAAIERERLNVPILADEHGYYLPADDVAQAEMEIKQFIQRQTDRLASNRRAIKGACRALNEIKKETSMQCSIEGYNQ
jgi:hypothetical protein